MSFDYGYKLAAPQPCHGKAVGYAANVFVSTFNRRAAVRQIDLGDKFIDAALLRNYAEPTIRKLNQVERNKVIAINFFKLCNARPHTGIQLERVGALAFTDSANRPIPLIPSSLKVSGGIGLAKCDLPTNMTLDPIIDFATVESERFTHAPKEAVEAAVSHPGRRAYIALRGLETAIALR